MGKRISNKGKKARKNRPYARSERGIRSTINKEKLTKKGNPYQATI